MQLMDFALALDLRESLPNDEHRVSFGVKEKCYMGLTTGKQESNDGRCMLPC